MSGFVYAIECSGRIKLGFSEDPERRFNKVASDAPFPCDLLGYWPGSKADELAVQDKFRELRVHGEWFASTESLLAFIGENAIAQQTGRRFAVSDNDGPLARWRKENRKTLDEVSDELGVSRQSWWRWETGKSRVAPKHLRKVEAITGIPRAQLRPDIFGPAPKEAAE